MRVAIIGGGWAGLAAAIELIDAGAGVCVFEAARQLGGRARSVAASEAVLDNGQHILVGAYRETLRLIARIGASPEQLLKRLPLELSFPGSRPPFRLRLPRLPAPLHLALGLFGAGGASLSEKFGAVRFMRALQAADYRLDADCTVAELLDRHAQRGRLRQHLWEPLCLAALNTDPERASAQIFANVLRDSLGGGRADTDLLLPAADLDRLLPQPAATFIRARGGEIRLSARVEHIGHHANGCLAIDDEPFDRIVLATAPQHAAHLLENNPATAALARLLTGYRYEPIGTVYAAYPAALRLPFPMLGLDDRTGNTLGQWVIDRGQLGGTPGLMSFVLSAHGAWDQCDNQALAATLHAELERVLQIELPRAAWHQVIRERRATFSCRPNLPRPSAETPRPGLWLAGDYVCADYPATLEGAVRSGIATAQAILANGHETRGAG